MNETLYKKLTKCAFLDREGTSHKGSFGKTLIIGGSPSFPGAPILASIGANAASPGYICISTPAEIATITKSRAPLTAIYESFPPKEFLNYDCILFGNGIENNFENLKLLDILFEQLTEKHTLIIDATGLDLFIELGRKTNDHKCNLILTPHLGEASRLIENLKIEKKPENFIGPLREFSVLKSAYILLKSYCGNLQYFGNNISYEYPQTPCLAKAGSGDVLAGFLAGLLCYLPKQGFGIENIIEFGDTIFHKAFFKLQEKYGPALVEPNDIKEALKEYLFGA